MSLIPTNTGLGAYRVGRQARGPVCRPGGSRF